MRTISDMVKEINSASDKEKIVEVENFIVSRFFSHLIAVGSTIIFIIRFFLLHEETAIFLPDIIVLLSFSLFVGLYSRLSKNEKAKEYIITIMIALTLTYVAIRLYYLFGTLIWIGSLIFVFLSVFRMHRIMLVIMSVTSMTLLQIMNVLNESEVYVDIIQSFILVIVVSVCLFMQKFITQRYIMIKKSEERINYTLSSVGDGVIATGVDGTVEYINPIAQKLTGWSKEGAVGNSIDSIFHLVSEEDLSCRISPVSLMMESGQVCEPVNELILVSRDGTKIPITYTASPIVNFHNSNIVGCVLVFKDFSERNKRIKMIEYLSYHDLLTGLYNRRFFEEEINRLDTKRNLPLSIIYADINGLKTFNDAFGHETGDLLIQEISAVFKTQCRADDIMARTGGDEFMLLLPKTTTSSAIALIDRINEALNHVKVMDINTSISFGWETKISESQSFQDIMRAAEDLMYRSKILIKSSKQSMTIKSIYNSLLLKSPQESAHSERVSLLCQSYGESIKLSDIELHELKLAGELHDIGKIAIDEAILNKKGRLTKAQREKIMTHSEIGYRLLSTSNEFSNISDAVFSHHERWDGSGYPRGLRGIEIPIYSRIIAVADSYDAMTCDRPYREPVSKEEAIEEIRKNAGTQFDPEVAKIFVEKVFGMQW